MITKDIEELAKEKHVLETDIAQKEADIKIKNGEIKSLQSELDTLAATLKQLENQKGEAQKRLNDLKGQQSSVEKELDTIKLELEEEQMQVDNLRRQAEEQEQSLRSQEDELSCKKQELEGLKQEEAKLEQQQQESRSKLDNLTKTLQDTQLQISQAKAKITDLQEQHRQMKDSIALYDNVISTGDVSSVPDTSLNFAPEFRDPEFTRMASVNGASSNQDSKKLKEDKDPFSSLNGPVENDEVPFGGEDLFRNDPFKSTNSVSAADPFSSADPFSAAFPSKPSGGFVSDPFTSFGEPASTAKNDPFDPFGDGKGRSKTPVDMSGKDPFGCDPFAALHPAAAPPRPESPSPALPPKKSKQPPPRPAPPRPSQQPPMRAAPQPPTPSPDPTSHAGSFSNPSDPFAASSDPFSSSGGSGAFADFANFESKFSDSADNKPSEKVQNGPSKASPPPPPPPVSQPRYAGLEFTEDPFSNYRYEDPFNSSNPFEENNTDTKPAVKAGTKLDPFGLETDSGFSSDFRSQASPPLKLNGSKNIPSEDQQLAWAAAESLRLEEERRQRAEQERSDLEFALKLSREAAAQHKAT